MSKATVTMSLEEYNEMHEELLAFRKSIKVQRRWTDSPDIEVSFDVRAYKESLVKVLKKDFPNAQLKYDFDEEYTRATCTIAYLPEVKEVE